ncbi:hypothetical protein GCM10010411_32330 [Actinomadura fulvescens]|uniref:Uncharacterized protein n=1 Tax=Actinomadura fulvescens TaxID=46160 RepID=A0ABP6C0L3_9ACTN
MAVLAETTLPAARLVSATAGAGVRPIRPATATATASSVLMYLDLIPDLSGKSAACLDASGPQAGGGWDTSVMPEMCETRHRR